VLAAIAGEIGFDRDAVVAFLESKEGVEDVRALERKAHAHGIQGVPHFDIGGIELVGAQPVATIRQAILKAVGQLAPCSAA
jgi:predicted DsbA family dithiol-disulfide isomerase